MRVPVRPLSLLCLVLAPLACVGGSDSQELVETTGHVLWEGKPVEGAMVEFHPDADAGTTGPIAVAETDARGQFRLRTAGRRAGVVPGRHRIRIAVPSDPYADKPASSPLPAMYADASTSGLTAQVDSTGEPIEIDFFLP